MKSIKIGSLFAGIGGIEMGLQNAGFNIAWSNEIDKKACVTFKENFNHRLIEKDVNDLKINEVEKIDFLTAGFPCQAFSIAGYRKGFDDDRGNVFFQILRFIDAFKPKVLLLENVKNLVSHDKGNTFKIIKSELEQRGYNLSYKVLNSAEYGNIPQNRERIYIVGFKYRKHLKKFKFPSKIELNVSIKDLLDSDIDQKFYYINSRYYPILKKEMTNKETLYQWRRVYVRENKSNLCPTLTANMGTGGHNVPLLLDHLDIRKLTPRECARFQGYDNSFVLPESLPNSALYKQIGNSVTVPVIEAIGRKIKQAIE